jgi:predicted MFS family arabinose efflux permease
LLNRTFKAFQYRDFRLIWSGACTSSIGTWMQSLAQSWLVLQISGSAFLLGLTSFLGEIPIFLFSLVGGVVADRMDRRRLLLASQYVQMTCAFTLTALIAFGLVRVWHILVLSFLVGLAQSFGGPAYQALIPSLVKTEDIPNAIALNSIQFNLARIIGPVLGGLALTGLGAAWCFGLNGLSFVAVIISLLLLKVRFIPQGGGASMLASMKEGIAFVRKQGAIESLLVLAFLSTMLGVPLVVFLPVIAKDVFHGGASTYTLLLSISGAGSVSGALVVATLGHFRHKGRVARLMLVVFGACMTGFALSRVLALSCVLLFLAGMCLVSVFATLSSLVQLLASDGMRGRVMSVYNVAFRGGMPMGSLLTGTLIRAFSAPVVLACDGALLICLALYFLLVHRRVAAL